MPARFAFVFRHVEEFSNADDRSLTQDLVSDEPGRMSKGDTPGTKSAMDPRTTVHEAAAETFARQLADFLKHHSSNSDFTPLSLVAPAHFLGLLRSILSKETEHVVRSSLAKRSLACTGQELDAEHRIAAGAWLVSVAYEKDLSDPPDQV